MARGGGRSSKYVGSRGGAVTTRPPSSSSSAAVGNPAQAIPAPVPPARDTRDISASSSSHLPSDSIGPTASLASVGSSSESRKIKINVACKRLIPSNTCSRRITQIFKAMIYPKGYEWKKIPEQRIRAYFHEFKKFFTWDPNELTEELVYDTWLKQAAIRYSGMLNKFKEKRDVKKPECIFEDVWKIRNEYWDSPDAIEKSEQQRQNQLTDVDGPGTGISRHRGGSKSYYQHQIAMTEELGETPLPFEFLKCMQLKDGKFVDDRSERVANQVQESIDELIAGGAPLENIDMSQLYMGVVGQNKQRVYGLGCWAPAFIAQGSSTTASLNEDAFRRLKEDMEQQFKEKMEAMQAEMQSQVRAQVQVQVQEMVQALLRSGTLPPVLPTQQVDDDDTSDTNDD